MMRSGRDSEMEALIEPHIPALRRFAWALLQHEAAADDLVQDCLERAISRWHLRRLEGSPKAWLFAILHNLFISGRRSAAKLLRISSTGSSNGGTFMRVPVYQMAAPACCNAIGRTTN